MMEDIVIIGAGASGLMAANLLSGKGMNVLVIEADNRIGGRVHTVIDPAFPVPLEMGAEFVHGRLPLTLGILRQAGIKYEEDTDGMIKIAAGKWTKDDDFIEGWDELIQKMQSLKVDISLQSFLDLYYPGQDLLRQEVIRFAQGFDLADAEKASIKVLVNEWSNNDHRQYRIPGGYKKLLDHLADSCRASGAKILINSPVNKIDWKKNKVSIQTKTGRVFEARKVIVTVPLGIIQQMNSDKQMIEFNPSLSGLLQNADHIGYGSVIKYFTLFENFFSTELNKSSLIISDQQIPTWWVRFFDNDVMLTGWLGGPPSRDYNYESIAMYREQALASISGMFRVDKSDLEKKMKAFRVINWSQQQFAKGAYSYDMVGSKDVKKMFRQPMADTVYFAGEGLYDGNAPGTVEAALQSGKDVAQKLMTTWEHKQA